MNENASENGTFLEEPDDPLRPRPNHKQRIDFLETEILHLQSDVKRALFTEDPIGHGILQRMKSLEITAIESVKRLETIAKDAVTRVHHLDQRMKMFDEELEEAKRELKDLWIAIKEEHHARISADGKLRYALRGPAKKKPTRKKR